MPPSLPEVQTAADLGSELERDAADLRRGAVANLLGLLLRFSYPVLAWLVITLYGKEAFGGYAAAEASLVLVLRVCLFGLDKGILWWVPRQPPALARRDLLSALAVVGVCSAAAAVLVAALWAPWLAEWQGEPDAVAGLRWMAAGLVPTALTEVLVAAVARRRIGAQILAREGVVTLSMAAAAVGFHQAGMGAAGLPAAFGASRLAGLATALVLCRGVFPRGGGGATAVRLPRQLRRYAGPVWLAEVANSALLRMDVMLLTVMVDAGTVGVYAAVMQVANSLRSVRRSFDPIVTAIFSEIGAAHSPRRLAAGFSRATSLVLATQLPIFAVLAAAIPWIMRALGPGFADGADAALVLCAFWMVNGVLGLSGVIVTGYGHSGLALANVLATLVVQSALFMWMVPHHGLMGAVVAVGASQAILNLAQLAEASVLTRTRFYGPEVLWTAGLGAVAGATMVAGWAIAAGSGPLASRMVGLFLFAAVFAPGLVWLHRALRCGGGAELR